jgi:hypothetical protein
MSAQTVERSAARRDGADIRVHIGWAGQAVLVILYTEDRFFFLSWARLPDGGGLSPHVLNRPPGTKAGHGSPERRKGSFQLQLHAPLVASSLPCHLGIEPTNVTRVDGRTTEYRPHAGVSFRRFDS